jgi:hypothetical protein
MVIKYYIILTTSLLNVIWRLIFHRNLFFVILEKLRYITYGISAKATTLGP